MRTKTTPKTETTTLERCGTCTHFRLSLREGEGRSGVCMFFRQLMTVEGYCTAGYQSRDKEPSDADSEA